MTMKCSKNYNNMLGALIVELSELSETQQIWNFYKLQFAIFISTNHSLLNPTVA